MKTNKAILFLTTVCAVLALLCGCSSDTQIKSANYPTNKEIKYGFTDYTVFDNFLTDGVFKCGVDFESGDYYILSLYGANAQYDVSNKSNDFSYSNQRMMRKISVKDKQYVKLDGAIMVAAAEIDTTNWKKYGVFLVGTDLPAGEYKIESITDEYHTKLDYIQGINGAYQICNKSPDNEPEQCTPLFESQAYITLKDGQYIAINNANLTLCESN